MEPVPLSSLKIGDWFKTTEAVANLRLTSVLAYRVVKKHNDGFLITSGGLSMGFMKSDELVIPLPDFS